MRPSPWASSFGETTLAGPKWPSHGRKLQVGGMSEKRRPLSILGPNPRFPSVQVHLLERPGSAREPRRGPPLSQPEELVGESVACKAQRAPRGRAPRANWKLELRTGRPPTSPGWSRARGPEETQKRRSEGSATSGKTPSADTARAVHSPEPPSVACSLGAKFARVLGVGGGGWGPRARGKEMRTGETHLPS